MSANVVNESIFFISCFLTGIAVTLLYDVIRIFRRILMHGSLLIALEDGLFWAAVSVMLFLLLYHMNNGTLRWFAVFGLFAGMWLYKKIFKNYFVDFMSTILKRILHIVVSVLSVPLRVVKTVFFPVFSRLWGKTCSLKKQLTGNIKKVKITLCKRNKPEKGKQNES
jgi:spore cortex biosynthesis protein YabQ